jgi:hypothetical protein
MSWCEDYIDPFPRRCDHGVPDGINCDSCADEDTEDDEEEWECIYPGECLMPGMGHHSSECYTVEDAEEMDGGV